MRTPVLIINKGTTAGMAPREGRGHLAVYPTGYEVDSSSAVLPLGDGRGRALVGM